MAAVDSDALKAAIQSEKDQIQKRIKQWHQLYHAFQLEKPSFEKQARVHSALSRFHSDETVSAMEAHMEKAMNEYARMSAALSDVEDKESYTALQDLKRSLDQTAAQIQEVKAQCHALQETLGSAAHQTQLVTDLGMQLLAKKALIDLHEHKLTSLRALYEKDPSVKDAKEWDIHYRTFIDLKEAHEELATLIATVDHEEDRLTLLSLCDDQRTRLDHLTLSGQHEKLRVMQTRIASGDLDWHAVRALQLDPYMQQLSQYDPSLKTALTHLGESMQQAFSTAVIDRSRVLMLATPKDEILDLKNVANSNYKKVVQSFNGLVRFVKADITREKNRAFRIKAIEQWVDIAKRCELEEDYSSLKAIHSALTEVLRPQNRWMYTHAMLHPSVTFLMEQHETLLKKPNLNKRTPFLGGLRMGLERLKTSEGAEWKHSDAVRVLLDEYESHRDALRNLSISDTQAVMDVVVETPQPADFFARVRQFAEEEARCVIPKKDSPASSNFDRIDNKALRNLLVEQGVSVYQAANAEVIAQLNDAKHMPITQERLAHLLGELSVDVTNEQLQRIHRENQSACQKGPFMQAMQAVQTFDQYHRVLNIAEVRDHIKTYAYFVKTLPTSRVSEARLADHVLEVAVVPAGARVDHPVFRDFKALQTHKSQLESARGALVLLKDRVLDATPINTVLEELNRSLAFYDNDKVQKYAGRIALLENWATNAKQKAADEERAFKTGVKEGEVILRGSRAVRDTPMLAEQVSAFAKTRPVRNKLKRISDKAYFDQKHQQLSSVCVDEAYQTVLRVYKEEYKPALDRFHALLQDSVDARFDASEWTAWKNAHHNDVPGLMAIAQQLKAQDTLHRLDQAFRALEKAHGALGGQFVQLNHMYTQAHPGQRLSRSDLASAIRELRITQQIDRSAKYFSVAVNARHFSHVPDVKPEQVNALLTYHKFTDALEKHTGIERRAQSAARVEAHAGTLKERRTRVQRVMDYAKAHPVKAAAGAVVLGSAAAVAHVPALAGIAAVKGAVAVKAAIAAKAAAGAVAGGSAVSAVGSRRQARSRAHTLAFFGRSKAKARSADTKETFEFANPLHQHRRSAPTL